MNFEPKQPIAAPAHAQPLLRLVSQTVEMQDRVENALLDRHIQLDRQNKCPELDALLKRIARKDAK